MNVIVMIGMMGLMLLLFHGRGHHRSAPEPGHDSNRPAVAPTVPPSSPEAVHPSVGTRAETEDEVGSGAKAKPESNPKSQVVPQGE